MSQPVLDSSGQWRPPGDGHQFPFGPLLLAVLPNNGPVAGGGTVQLLGLGLSDATGVLFGTTPATIVADDPSVGLTLTVTVPAHSDGTVPVTVVTSRGTSNPVSYTYTTPPAPTPPTAVSINPVSGPVADTTPFVITGTDLAGASVTFNGIPAAVLGTDPSGTLVFGISPAGAAAGSVPVVVTTASGTATVPGGYTYI
jgi:hypothetical protein